MFQFGNWEIKLKLEVEDNSEIDAIKQVHGGRIVRNFELHPLKPTEADGVVLSQTDGEESIKIKSADCLPLVLMTDDEALALHVSRKTLINGLLENAEKFINLRKIKHAFIGPHICPEHFTFEWEGPEITRFTEMFPEAAEEEGGAWSLSVRDALQTYLDKWKIADSKITEDDRCTFEASELPSYRRSEGKLDSQLITVVRASTKS